MNRRLLMIEDDRRLATMVRDFLGQNGFTITHAEDAQQGLATLHQEPFDILLLDLMLPDADGLELCRRIRREFGDASEMPIIMVTAKGDPMERVVGLELGADDYLAKPFEPRELLARIRAVLRRSRNGGGQLRADILRFGRLEIDCGARLVRIDGVVRSMTSYQFDLTAAMAKSAGRVLSRDQLMNLVKGEPLEAFDRSIDVHIARIRAAIEDDPKHPRRIVTVRGAGYVFAKAQDE
jgi:two-component system phosphate regulon response regulator OmpR